MITLDCSNQFIKITGRYETTEYKSWRFSFPGISIKIRIKCATLKVVMKDHAQAGRHNYFNIIIGNEAKAMFHPDYNIGSSTIFENEISQWRTVELFKRTESEVGVCEFFGFETDDTAEFQTIDDAALKIEFIGDSLTCGYGIEAQSATDPFEDQTENAWLSFAGIVARQLSAQTHMIACSGKGIYRNWGESDFASDTMSDIYYRTFAYQYDSTWDFSRFIPNIVVINLGSNDFSPPVYADKTLFTEAYNRLLNNIRMYYGKECTIFCVTGPVLIKTLGDNHDRFIKEIVDDRKSCGDNHIHFFPLTRQNGKTGYGAQWHPNIIQSEKNGLELSRFIQDRLV